MLRLCPPITQSLVKGVRLSTYHIAPNGDLRQTAALGPSLHRRYELPTNTVAAKTGLNYQAEQLTTQVGFQEPLLGPMDPANHRSSRLRGNQDELIRPSEDAIEALSKDTRVYRITKLGTVTVSLAAE